MTYTALRRWSGNVGLLLLSCVASLLLVEAILRVFFPYYAFSEPILYNDELIYKPNQSAHFKGLEWDVNISINAEGFRDTLTRKDLTPGSIVFLGDSFTEGYGVALKDTFVKHLDRRLNENTANIRVMNAGHYGANPNNYIAVYETYFSDLDTAPTVIMGLFVGNDFIQSLDGDPRLKIAMHEANSFAVNIKSFISQHVVTYNFLRKTVRSSVPLTRMCVAARLCSELPPSEIYAPSIIKKSVETTATLIGGFSKDLKAKGRNLVVLIIPTKEQILDDVWKRAVHNRDIQLPKTGSPDDFRYFANTLLRQNLKDDGVLSVDLTPFFLSLSNDERARLYFQHDGHFSPRGHKLAADHLFSELASFGFIPQ